MNNSDGSKINWADVAGFSETISPNKIKDIVVLYHANCLDGFGAAYAAWKALGDTAEYIPVQYGNPTPLPDADLIFGKIVYVLDFSYKADQIVRLERLVRGLIIIDHHSGALLELQNALDALDKIDEDSDPTMPAHCYSYHYGIDKCGAVLTWEYFNPISPGYPLLAKPVPKLLLHIQDGDLGWVWNTPDKCFPGSKEIRAALSSKAIFSREFEEWDRIITEWADYYYAELVHTGQILLVDFEGRCQAQADKAYPCRISHTEMAPL